MMLRAWTNCMRSAGYRFTTLQGPWSLLQRKLGDAGSGSASLRRVGRLELRIAQQDLECERQVKFHETVQKIQGEVEGS